MATVSALPLSCSFSFVYVVLSQTDHLSEKPEISGILIAIREMSGILLKVREVSDKNLIQEKWPKTVYC